MEGGENMDGLLISVDSEGTSPTNKAFFGLYQLP